MTCSIRNLLAKAEDQGKEEVQHLEKLITARGQLTCVDLQWSKRSYGPHSI